MNKKLLDEVNSISKGILIYDIIVVMIISMFNLANRETLSGLAFGSIIAALNLRLLGISIQKMVTMQPKQAQTYLFAQYTSRTAISAVVLVISALADHIHILTTVLGLLSTKFVILINKLVVEEFLRKGV